MLTTAQGEVHWEKLLGLVMGCKAELENTIPAGEVDSGFSLSLGEWLAAVRLDGIRLTELTQPCLIDQERLVKLLDSIGIRGIEPTNILVAAEAGSHLYNLTLPTSDTDYIIIYRHPTHALISSVNYIKVKVQLGMLNGRIM